MKTIKTAHCYTVLRLFFPERSVQHVSIDHRDCPSPSEENRERGREEKGAITGASAVHCFYCSSCRWRRGEAQRIREPMESAVQMAASWTRQGTRACVTAQTRTEEDEGGFSFLPLLLIGHVAIIYIDASTVLRCCYCSAGRRADDPYRVRERLLPGPPDKRSSCCLSKYKYFYVWSNLNLLILAINCK